VQADYVPSLGITEMLLIKSALEGSDDLRIVVGAQGEARGFDLLMLVSETDWSMEDHEYPSVDSAMERLEGQQVLRLAQAGSGHGIWAATNVEVHWPWADLDLLMRLGDVSVDEDQTGTPAGPVITRTTFAQAPAGQGWSAGMGYEGSNDFAGEWSLEGRAHDLELLDRSPTVGSPDGMPMSLAGAAMGYPLYQFTADGEGDVEVTMQVRGLDNSDETFRMFSLATFGTPLQDLIGVPGRDAYMGWGAASRWLNVGPQLPVP
jgi:hypothetical protein